jgi:hypothetical protein
MRHTLFFGLLFCLLFWANRGLGQCWAGFHVLYFTNSNLTLESTYSSGTASYQWSVTGPGCSISGNGAHAAVTRPPGVSGSASLTVTDGTCQSTWGMALPLNPLTPVVASGPTSVCGTNPSMYTCQYLYGSLQLATYYHQWNVIGGTIYSQRSSPIPVNTGTVYDTIGVIWGTGPVGRVISNYCHCILQQGAASLDAVTNVAISCGMGGSHYGCLNVPQDFWQNCPPGSTFAWSTIHGTILSGQNTDSIKVQWAFPCEDTIVSIFNSTACGLDTAYFPVHVLPYPTNTIVGDTLACEHDQDTLRTQLLPNLNPPSVTKRWQVTGGGGSQSWSSSNAIHYIHGPGPWETITLTTNDHGCVGVDSMRVHILQAPVMNLGPDPNICFGDSVLLNAGAGLASYAWSTGASASAIWIDTIGTYMVTVTNSPNNCHTVDTVVSSIDYDCVWPGDVNQDFVVDLNDFLDLGVAMGTTGGPRPNASINWQGQPAANWGITFLSGTDMKHADSDGSGLVDLDDTLSVTMFQGNTHLRIGEVTSGIPLRIRPSMPLFAGQDSVELIVELGTASRPADSAYGLAFILNYANAEVFPGLQGSVSPSFLGAVGNQYAAMRHEENAGGQYGIAMTRTDHAPRNGFGEVARIKLRAQPALWTHQTRVPLPLSLSQLRLTRPDGSDLPIVGIVDSVFLYDLGYVGAPAPSVDFDWDIFPVPASNVLHLRIDRRACGPYSISLIDQNGKVVGMQSGLLSSCTVVNEVEFPTTPFGAGVYALQITTRKASATKRVVILR